MSEQHMILAGEFPAADHAAWMEAVNKILGGRDFDRVLTNQVGDGIVTQPLYTSADELPTTGLPGTAPHTRGGNAAGNAVNGWDIRQVHGLRSPAELNGDILRDLQRGVTSIELMTVGLDQDGMARALEGVHLEMAPIALMAPDNGVEAAQHLLGILDQYGQPNSALAADLGCDPIARLADHGTVGLGSDEAIAQVAELAGRAAGSHEKVRTVRASSTPFAHAGASAGDELGLLASSMVAYLRALTAQGLSVDQALSQILLSLTVGTDQFLDMAKLRAARRIAGRIAQASGATDGALPCSLQTVTSLSVLTTRDPWVNILRATLGTAASALGGADIVTVIPFDAYLGQSDALGLRVARNTQLILQHESNLHRVVDPAGGSWYIEQLTDQIAAAGWKAFQAVEAQGGVVAALQNGWVQERLAATWHQTQEAVAKRKVPVTGVSEFPDIDEAPVTRQPVSASASAPVTEIDPLPTNRLAQPWEDLRSQNESAGSSVFLANLGPPAVHTARATFAKNLFEAGGIRAIANDGFETHEDLVAAYVHSGASLAVLCSNDDTYQTDVASVAPALKAAGCSTLFLAGNPADQEDAYRSAGVDCFVHLGANVLGLLKDADLTKESTSQ